MALSKKHQKFADEYLACRNASEAARRAGYSALTARKIGNELKRKPAIAEYLNSKTAPVCVRQGVTIERVIQELAAVAFANMGDYMSWNDVLATLKNSAELSYEQTAAVQSVRATQFGYVVTLHDKIAALDKLSKILLTHKRGEGDEPEDIAEVFKTMVQSLRSSSETPRTTGVDAKQGEA